VDDRRGAVNTVFSFVIPVRNDAIRLDRCLRSIQSAAGPAHALDVLVVDNGSTDNSAAVAMARGARVVRIENLRVSALRNRGATQTLGEIVAFVDADNEVGAGWLDAVAANFRTPQVGATGAQVPGPPLPGVPPQRTVMAASTGSSSGDPLFATSPQQTPMSSRTGPAGPYHPGT